MRCWLHKWSKWKLVNYIAHTFPGKKFTVTRQERECLRCGKRQLETL